MIWPRHTTAEWTEAQIISFPSATLYFLKTETLQGSAGDLKRCAEELGVKRPELSPRRCHSLAAFGIKSKTLSLVIGSHQKLTSTSFPTHLQINFQCKQYASSYSRSFPLSPSMLLLIQFSQLFLFSILQSPPSLETQFKGSIPIISPPPCTPGPPKHQTLYLSQQGMTRDSFHFLPDLH